MAEQSKFLDKIGLQHLISKLSEVLVKEAPEDSKLYGRKNGNWVEVVPEAPMDGKIYGRMDGNWVVNEPSSSTAFDVIENVLITSDEFQTIGDILILI